jgi:lipopolysaccharide assembly protein A
MRALYWPLAALAAVVLTLFSVSNRQSVTLELWPVPFALDAPLYLIVLVSLAVGFATGELAAWIGGRRRRRQARQYRRRIAALERELAATQAQFDRPSEPAPL